jgi:multiple sugar transport system substrate-binding protein
MLKVLCAISVNRRFDGHTAQLNIISSDQYFSNKIHNFLEGEQAADVYMSGPVLLWEHVSAGFVEPLDDFVKNSRDEYQPDDFIAPLIQSNRWSGRFGDPLGSGPLLEIPVNCESYNLAYVPEILDRCGIEVPTTWEEYFRAADQITEKMVRLCAVSASEVWMCGIPCTRVMRHTLVLRSDGF